MRVLITGITGFVGVHLASTLQDCGHVVGGTWFGEPPAASERWLYSVDLAEPGPIARAVADFAPDAIVHLAGASHVGTSWSRMGAYHRINVLGTEFVLDAAGEVPVVLASSAEVYGPVPEAEQPIEEDRTPDPSSPYALTKAAAERLVIGRGGIVARLFNLIGPGQAVTFALPTFAQQLRSIERGAEPILRVGNLAARRDFVHVKDGARALAQLATTAVPRSVIYQVATGRAYAISEVLERLLKVSGVEARIEIDPDRLRPVDVPLLVGNPVRLSALGWAPEFGIDDAVGDLWNSLATPEGASRDT
ncbi:MAG: GDP-mannose 4,6-dehydratase [Thermoanaerobaculia bacterium]|nr:GDP-mannose 4,6-dehydratase [Thermoanaerobaculia bacterium]